MDEYYLAHEKLIEEAWQEHYKQNKIKDNQMEIHYWGGGRYDAPPF